jgi:hypothetical protein
MRSSASRNSVKTMVAPTISGTTPTNVASVSLPGSSSGGIVLSTALAPSCNNDLMSANLTLLSLREATAC